MARAGSVAASATQSEGQRFDASREPRVLTRNSQRILHEESWHPSLAVGRRQQHSSTRNRVPVAALGRRGQGTSIARRACSAEPRPQIPACEPHGAHAHPRAVRLDYAGATAECDEWVHDEPFNWEGWGTLCWALE